MEKSFNFSYLGSWMDIGFTGVPVVTLAAGIATFAGVDSPVSSSHVLAHLGQDFLFLYVFSVNFLNVS